jgi:hypothetical protein
MHSFTAGAALLPSPLRGPRRAKLALEVGGGGRGNGGARGYLPLQLSPARRERAHRARGFHFPLNAHPGMTKRSADQSGRTISNIASGRISK